MNAYYEGLCPAPQGVEGEREWKEEGERKEAQKGLQDYLHQLYVVVRESLLMAPLMPGAYLHAFLALPRGLAAANAAATIYCVDGGKTPCALPAPRWASPSCPRHPWLSRPGCA